MTAPHRRRRKRRDKIEAILITGVAVLLASSALVLGLVSIASEGNGNTITAPNTEMTRIN